MRVYAHRDAIRPFETPWLGRIIPDRTDHRVEQSPSQADRAALRQEREVVLGAGLRRAAIRLMHGHGAD
ncbi:MAG: hypothetical protein AAFX05_14890, partial [Planctomycetota bacterium]